MISFFNKIHFSNSVTPCLVEKEIEERKKKIIACLIQKKRKKKNKNNETQLAIFQQQNRPLYTTEADVWGMLTEWNVIDPCML